MPGRLMRRNPVITLFVSLYFKLDADHSLLFILKRL